MIQADSEKSTAMPGEAPARSTSPPTPEQLFQAIGRPRQEAQDEIERLLAFLDRTEPDPDLEPYLTGYSPGMDDQEDGESEDEGADGADDREPNVDDDDDGAGEPSFGWNDEEAALGRDPSIMGRLVP